MYQRIQRVQCQRKLFRDKKEYCGHCKVILSTFSKRIDRICNISTKRMQLRIQCIWNAFRVSRLFDLVVQRFFTSTRWYVHTTECWKQYEMPWNSIWEKNWKYFIEPQIFGSIYNDLQIKRSLILNAWIDCSKRASDDVLILATVNYFDCRLLGLDGLNFQIYFISHVPMVGSIAAAVIIVAVASLIIKNKQKPRVEKMISTPLNLNV